MLASARRKRKLEIGVADAGKYQASIIFQEESVPVGGQKQNRPVYAGQRKVMIHFFYLAPCWECRVSSLEKGSEQGIVASTWTSGQGSSSSEPTEYILE